MTNSYKKEYPFVGYAGFGGGAGALSYKSAASKKYIDDVFSTYLYTGNASTRSISNGIDLSGEGGLVWTKSRSSTQVHGIIDTIRGVQKVIAANDDWAEYTEATSITAFNNNGYTMGSETHWNGSGLDFASWSFRKSAGFCDIVTWTGNATADRQISHNLGCVPGCILIKQTSGAAEDWAVYHRGIGSTKALKLNKTNEADTGIEYFQDTDPTATNFTIGVQPPVNGNGNEYVAYLFAGGEEQGNASVDFSGTNDRLTLDSTSDVNFGTGDFTVEFWLRKPDATHTGFFQISGTSGGLTTTYSSSLALGWHGSGYWQLYRGGAFVNGPSFTPTTNQWYHAAVVRSSGTTKVYIDGSEVISVSDTHDYSYNNLVVGGYYSTSYLMKGQISNFRITKGQALYTSSFTPTTSPLTTTSQSATASNVKLLCCNDIGASGFTKSPSPLELTGSPQGNTASPFAASTATDTSAVFGADEDQNIIKCGEYLGNGSSTGPVVNLGWEPQWVLIKRSSNSEDWMLFDSMRSIVTGGNDYDLRPNLNNAESTAEDWLELTSTGFQIKATYNHVNDNGNTYVYVAIRRPDGAVSKPAEAGTDVFALDTGASSSTIPNYDSNFPVDFAWSKKYTSGTGPWYTGARLTGSQYMMVDASNAGADAGTTNWTWDSNVGWQSDSGYNSDNISHMWKRGASFDVINYTGNGEAREIRHGLNAVPEMMWAKKRNSSGNWYVYHKDMNGGVSPENYFMQLDTYDSQQYVAIWNAAPTSTTFHLSTDGHANNSGDDFIAMLFTSVTGISKVGNFTPDSSGSFTVTTGFTPRFIVMKPRTFSDNNWGWWVYDSQRGLTSGLTNRLTLESTAAQISGSTNGTTATGINFTGWGDQSANNWIYYAHA